MITSDLIRLQLRYQLCPVVIRKVRQFHSIPIPTIPMAKPPTQCQVPHITLLDYTRLYQTILDYSVVSPILAPTPTIAEKVKKANQDLLTYQFKRSKIEHLNRTSKIKQKPEVKTMFKWVFRVIIFCSIKTSNSIIWFSLFQFIFLTNINHGLTL